MNSPEHDVASVRHITALPARITPRPRVIFTDVDDTLTCNGLLPVETLEALTRLRDIGVVVVPVTGASAGWCDCLIKTWPIQHIVGENGAITMEKNDLGVVSLHCVKSDDEAARDLARLMDIGTELNSRFPEVSYTQDQPYRKTDIAFDIGQAVVVDNQQAEAATAWVRTQGVQARRSSIHINVWLGDHSKASGSMQWLQQRSLAVEECLFIGDSPNDACMFEHFPRSVGVANIERFLPNLKHAPAYLTEHEGGYGFVELANAVLNAPVPD